MDFDEVHAAAEKPHDELGRIGFAAKVGEADE
jgi:hypothetical protein